MAEPNRGEKRMTKKRMHEEFMQMTVGTLSASGRSGQSSANTVEQERNHRERRKQARKIYTEGKYSAVYDEKGINVATGKDSCDCLVEECPGCHFPCPKCRSNKCGHECRQNRRWHYDSFEVEKAGDHSGEQPVA